MRVPGIVFADESLIAQADRDRALEQVINVAFLPGIVKASLAMPDIHWGYGFPIGGVAAFDTEGGVISPGGVGYDINCGVRLLKTNLLAREVKPLVEPLLYELARNVPKGVGSHGLLRLSRGEMEKALTGGVKWAIGQGYGWKEDADFIEEGGVLAGADQVHRLHAEPFSFQVPGDALGDVGGPGSEPGAVRVDLLEHGVG